MVVMRLQVSSTIKRGLGHSAAALSLLLASIVSFAWIVNRSSGLGKGELSLWRTAGLSVEFTTDRTTLCFNFIRPIDIVRITDQEYATLCSGRVFYKEDRWLGFLFQRGTVVFGGSGMRGFGVKSAAKCFIVGVPNALAVALLLVIPAVYWSRTIRLDRRARLNLCPVCGYRSPCNAGAMPRVWDRRVSPKPPHNPPMQRTGAAGIAFSVRSLAGRGSGR